MSEALSTFDRTCRLIVGRLEQCFGEAQRVSEADACLSPLELGADDALRDALASLDIAVDGEMACLVNACRLALRASFDEPLSDDLGLLSQHQWARYGKGKRNAAAPVHVLASWQQRLQQLADAAGDSTLLCLLGHSEPASGAAGASTYIPGKNPAATSLATAYPISADAFVVLAASVGLFCDEPPPFEKNAETICDRVLYRLGRREYTVRFARPTDIDALERLEDLCWIPQLRTSREHLLARIRAFPQGQFALEIGGEVKGVIYSQRIHDEADLFRQDMDTVHRLHDPAGNVVQLLAVNIDPDSQNLACGDQLLEFMLQRSSLQQGVRKIVAVTLCKNFSAEQGLKFEEYVTGPGKDCDRVLHFHHAHGAGITAVLPGYRPRDLANQGNGVLVEYDLAQRRQCRLSRKALAPTTAAAVADTTDARRFILETISALIDEAHSIDPERPLMESGLDSAGLLALKPRLETHFGKRLKPSFFFTFNTPQKIVDFFCAGTQVPAQGGIEPSRNRKGASIADDTAASKTEDGAGPYHESDIAIVGLACRLPHGIDDLDGLWDVLESQRDVIAGYPATRGPWPHGGGIERGGFLIDGECFDASFFRMSPSEAEVTDPQQRLLSEVSWACFEDACVVPATLRGTDTGVFVGASNSDYAHLLQDIGAEVEAHSAVGNSLAVLANRLSYFYDFHGPSLLIDTACSSSMVALHSAVQSLRAGDCRIALVGGVNFICNPRISLAYQKAGMLAPDGRCKVFDDSADGYVRSEGAVMLLLKPLRDAIADGHRIHAVIKGSAVNHGGQAAGLTVPNPQRQATLLASAWRNARVDPSRISYLEAHGTGTSLGDPIEIEGMRMAFGAALSATAGTGCGVGSVKSNIGHLESAAGLAGLLKVVAAMARRRLPASIHISRINSEIALQGTSLHIQTTPQEWHATQPRIAGVSSFGSGGANGHVVLQEYVAPAALDGSGGTVDSAFPDGNLFVLSAIDEAALRRNARAVIDWLRSRDSSQHFIDALHTWQCGRTAFKYRLAVHVRDFDELALKLHAWLESDGREVGFAKIDASAREDHRESSQWSEALARRDWKALAQHWLQGCHGEWRGLYDALASAPKFLKLPGYAFSKDRHWVPVQRMLSSQFLTHSADDIGVETQYLQPVWERHDLPDAVDGQAIDGIETHVFVWTTHKLDEPALRAALPGCRLTLVNAVGDTSASRYASLASRCFGYIGTLLREKSSTKIRFQLVTEDRGDGDWIFGLRGLLKTASIEEPRLDWQIITLPAEVSIAGLQAHLASNQHAFESGASIKYTDTTRLVRRWEQLPKSSAHGAPVSLRSDGAYLITGGLGGLGRLFAKQILDSAPDAHVIVTGRSAVDDRIEVEVESWDAGSRLEYRRLLLDKRDDVEALIASLRSDGLQLRGVLHCAGQVADNFIVNKSADEFAHVLAPKIGGTLYLDEATRDIDLDFFMLFSSVMSETGNAGQADYACANGFLDHYAAYRNALVAKGLRRGHSVSINWPLWRNGGMQVDASALALLKETRGMVPMPTTVGLEFFKAQDWRNAQQVLILHGDSRQLHEELLVNTSRHASHAGHVVDAAELLATTTSALAALVAEQLKLPVEKLDIEEELAHYGIDSIFVNKINLALSRHFSAVSKTLFFQYRTVAEIAGHLALQYAEECRAWTLKKASAAALSALANTTVGGITRESHARHPAAQVESGDDAIAIIGMSGVFPQAPDLDAYWRNLAAGKDCVTEVPLARWDIDEFYEPDVQRAMAQGKSYCKFGAFVDEFAQFDPMFFGISPREAVNIDPHERLFLQEAWRAMEDAGYSSDAMRQRHRRRVGVFVGVTKTEFELNGAHSPGAAGQWYPRTSFSSIANRLSFFMDLSGPSMPIDTMCSSSLTAIHTACEQIRLGSCEAAFAGAVNLYLHPSAYYYLSSLRMLSSDGRCRSFGENGSGFVPGEGAAVVLLKSLNRAVADGDHVHGVILATHVNHGGRTHGFMVPNPRAQAALIRESLDKAGVNARHVSYIEAHGTGTALGDPIEVEGLQQAFAFDTADRQFCALGSAKSNIGHLEAAAGIAGLLKVLLQMRHQQLAPTLHAEKTNPNIQFASGSFVLNRELRAWDKPVVDGRTLPRIAGVSSFGAGGVNAHVLVQEYETSHPVSAEQPSSYETQALIPLSAFRPEQLVARARQLLEFTGADAEQFDIHRIAHTLQAGRDPMAHRVAFIVDSVDALRSELEAFVNGRIGGATCVAGAADHGGTRAQLIQDVDACLAEHGRIDLRRLATLWASGATVEWQRLHRGKSTPRRLNMPTYPFAADTYWRGRLASIGGASDGSVSSIAAVSRPSVRSHAPPDGNDVLHAIPVWQTLDEKPASDIEVFSTHVVLLCDIEIQASMLAAALDHGNAVAGDSRCVAFTATGNDPAERYQSIALQCFEALRDLARDPSTGRTLIQCVIPNGHESQTYRGLSALLRTVAMEQSRFVGQVVGIDADFDADALAARLHGLKHQPSATLVQCQRDHMQALDWQPVKLRSAVGSVYKDDGVYVITGGLGALGRVFAANIVDHCAHATIVLTGRSPPTDAIVQDVNSLQRAHTQVVYMQLDLHDSGSVESAFNDLVSRYRTINGIIHCAGMISDNLLAKKSTQDFRATLLPKVTGTAHLDNASRNLDLDFFVVFSSIASAMGSVGQSDYAAANGFMDHFIQYRRERVRRGERSGASVSINWPYWQDGGMRIDATTQAVLAQSIGMQAMETGVGLSAFHDCVAMNRAQMVVAQGDPAKLLARLRGHDVVEHAAPPVAAAHGTLTFDRIQKELRLMLAAVLHARPEDIELRKPLVELGLDSVLGTEFVLAINQKFATALSSVGIYDHPNVFALAQYLEAAQPRLQEHAHAVREPHAQYAAQAALSHRDSGRIDAYTSQGGSEKLAVIGMSGRYPQAGNLEEYWQNLATATNSIVGIPDSRWDADAYYDADPDAEGKMYSRSMGILDNADAFDPRFFRIAPQEALYMDPEQRLFLQEGYRALEDAGYVGSDADGLNCGVYLGMESSEYSWQYATSPRISETITGNHSAIAASRMSYFLNLKGPALAIDTACSSSLVATHLACQALRSGEIDLALVGGVRLWLSPVTHIGMCKARMLSASGQCRTFDDAADGIVMGEGVGAVVLKRLGDAERDGDEIHGVVLASAINQDGRTNGITAPSIKSQIALESQLYRDHDIHPESISYIEAHGTGTKLGDPIELEALATVFRAQTQREGFCALGSVKTNIGHTAAASGIASLHKVLLCLKHRRLVPTLNVENENRHFDFKHSPFYVNRENKAWQPVLGDKRRACVSSFGFSGTNAHLVLEEYLPPIRMDKAATAHDELLIALSARNPAQLKQKARDLLAFIERHAPPVGEPEATIANRLPSLAYMLQVGRAAMEERAGFVVRSLDELKAGLRTLGEDAMDTVGVQRGRVVEDDETLGLWNTDEDLRLTLDKWLSGRKLDKLLGLWAKGVDFEWRKLYRASLPMRMSLPTYPFAEERFWIARGDQAMPAAEREQPVSRLHPLVHRNISDLGRQAYRTRLNAGAFYLDDHRVNGARVLPGVAYLEMARAALALALPAADDRFVEFRNHAWIQPIVVDDDVEVTVTLFDNSDDPTAEYAIDYEITSETDATSTLHCRGSLHCSAAMPALEGEAFESEAFASESLESIDVVALDDALDGMHYEQQALYARFAALGLRYGPSMQGIVGLKTDDDEVLALLQLPNSTDPQAQAYVLHPAIMDAAMQCTICLLAGFGSASAAAAMPFSFDTMRVYAATSADMLAWVRPAMGSGVSGLRSFDIDVMDRYGTSCVQIRGLVSRPVAAVSIVSAASQGGGRSLPASISAMQKSSGNAGTATLRALLPRWNPVLFGDDTVRPAPGEKVLLLSGGERAFGWLRSALVDLQHSPIASDASIESIKATLAALSFDHLVWLAPDLCDDAAVPVVESQHAGVLTLFRIIKALTQLDHFEHELKITVVTCMTQRVDDADPVLPHHAGVHGMIGSIAKEVPLWRFRLLDIESIDRLSAREILALPWDEQGRGLACRNNEWHRQEFAEVTRIPASNPGYKHNGVYVVIGGAGGLGEVWTRHMVQHFDANVIWIGRRPLDEHIEAKLDDIMAMGKRPHYFAADASDESALASVVRWIGERFPKIDGVVHSALVLQDQSVRSMDETVFRQSLAAKVDVSVNLERVFRGHDLDFMLFFSSLSSFYRGAGQSNYSAGCTFKDSFAHSMRAAHGYPVKIVNWGYWGSVGIVTDEFYKKRMEALGFGSIEPEEAMQALQQFVASEMDQLAFAKVLADAALDEMLVSEEIRYYADSEKFNETSSDVVTAS
ncbi:MAG: SDR family NAD(P)-dependent oxidoreductase [Lysobacter sp.]|nr:SDR family NAD(P)-dependent oxidoreductase [Lysobacter sp.]